MPALQDRGFRVVEVWRMDNIVPSSVIYVGGGAGNNDHQNEMFYTCELYNSTGNGFTGYHYDPVFSNSTGSSSAAPPDPSAPASSQASSAGPTAGAALPLQSVLPVTRIA